MSYGNLGPLFHCLQVKKQSYLNPNPLFIKRGVLQNLLNVFVSVFAEGGENGGEVRQTDRETDGQIDGWISVFPAFLVFSLSLCSCEMSHTTSERPFAAPAKLLLSGYNRQTRQTQQHANDHGLVWRRENTVAPSLSLPRSVCLTNVMVAYSFTHSLFPSLLPPSLPVHQSFELRGEKSKLIKKKKNPDRESVRTHKQTQISTCTSIVSVLV